MSDRLVKLFESGRPMVNGWLALPCGFSAEIMACQGWDTLTIDLQHGLIDYGAATQMLSAIATTDTVPLVRAPWLDPGAIMKLLDAGALGVICPMINTAAEAEALVAACRYPPRGNRSNGPIRAAYAYGADYQASANERIMPIAMIETRSGLDNLQAILDVDGLAGVYIGPTDLGLALGAEPCFDPVDPRVTQAIETILSAARSRGKLAGIHCGSTAYAREMIAKGFRLVTIGSDARFIAAGAQTILSDMRDAQAPSEGGGY
ncbi:MAG: aldolase/citrate lyase family protein [Methyloligellaceae bacterium]